MKITIEVGKGGRSLVLGHKDTRWVVYLANQAILWFTALCALPLVVILMPLIWIGRFFQRVDKFRKGVASDLDATK